LERVRHSTLHCRSVSRIICGRRPRPAPSGPSSAAERPDNPISDVGTAPPGEHKARILVAEDERDIRDLINFTLTFAGHTMTLASNGQEAVTLAKQAAQNATLPDLIMMDVRMPKMTGYEACRELKADPQLNPIPVV